MNTFVSGFDWDTGNRAKCQKHGVSVDEIEGLFARPIMILPDTAHSTTEERLRAIGRTRAGRYVFLVFTVRERDGEKFIRPISARYMHRKEIDSYEEENPDL
ncbi:MAG: BrnT family toxin [Proteobacteria bacterium]|nr:BrnT family toxin [Pseudomonadota bacterium]